MEYYLDTKGYECPIPVLKAAKRIKKLKKNDLITIESDDPLSKYCLLYTSPSPRDQRGSRMPSSA